MITELGLWTHHWLTRNEQRQWVRVKVKWSQYCWVISRSVQMCTAEWRNIMTRLPEGERIAPPGGILCRETWAWRAHSVQTYNKFKRLTITPRTQMSMTKPQNNSNSLLHKLQVSYYIWDNDSSFMHPGRPTSSSCFLIGSNSCHSCYKACKKPC